MIEKLIREAIGLRCCRAYLGYGGILKLSFGDKIYFEHPKMRSSFHGEFDFHIGTLSWRLLKNDSIITGSYDDPNFIDSKFKDILDREMVDLQILELDLKIVLQENYVIEAFYVSGNPTELIEVYLDKRKKCITNNGGKWHSIAYDIPNEGWTEEDQIKDNFSKSTTNRWRQNVPLKSEKGTCRNCAYYLATTGEYYFWDYGLCSNGKSDYDGRVVGVDSYCERFSETLIGEE